MIILISILWFLVFFAIFGIIGFVVFDSLCVIFKRETPIAIEWVPLYVFLGLVLTEIVFFLLSFIYVDRWVSYIYVGVFLVYFLQLAFKKYKAKILSEKNAFFRQEKYKVRGILFVFILILVIFGYIALIIDTAPYGDAIDHTTVISMIIENKKYPGNYLPVDEMLFSIFRYPPGFRVLSVFTALFSSCYPIVATTYTATLSSCLIPLLIWSSIYVRTRSMALSLFGLACSLILPSWLVIPPLDGNDLVLGNLTNGTYPNQLAFLELIGFAAFLVHYRTLNRSTPKDGEAVAPEQGSIKIDVFLFIGMILIGIALILSHYLFTFFVLALFGVKILIIISISVRKILEKTDLKKKFLFKILIGIGVLAIGITAIYAIIYIVPILTNVFSFTIALSIGVLYLVTNPFGILITCSIVLFLVKLSSQKKLFDPDLFYMITAFTIVLIIVIPNLQAYFLIATYRSVIPVAGVAIIQMCCDSSLIILKIKERRNWVLKAEYEEKIRRGLVIILISLNVINTLAYPRLAVSWGVVSGSDDYLGMVWLNENVDKNTLVLNEPTFVGLFLSGYRWRNVVFVRQLSIFHSIDTTISYYEERASSAMEIFADPANYTNVKNIMNAYQITYLYLTSFSEFFDYSTNTRNQKPYDVVDQVANFSANPYLELVWNRGYTAVFKLK